ncbi:hypothetical protein [Rhabdochromatium marinum]|uniref:hypothetical protein n=1 Tax=Rhabdochromatium marinum TaxID=48729 RepID=UPI0019030819|nr:hypothetical protein [Rhabdochromatium marinum]MBK1647921.1 hypothetical protein [Rhabdochromatium marinum]
MIDAPIYVPFVPYGRPTGSERLGVGRVSAIPETDRALNSPDPTSAKAAFSERRAGIQSSLAGQQPVARNPVPTNRRSYAEVAARYRIAAGGDSDSGSWFYSSDASATPGTDNSGGSRTEATAQEAAKKLSSYMSQRVQLSVRLTLPSEEPSRQLSILV